MDAGLILLSGGKSSRMGTNKALLPVEGKLNIERILESLGENFKDRIIVTNTPDEYRFLQGKVNIVPDIYPGLGPLSGIHAGLVASKAEYNVVVACDMPFVSEDLARVLVEKSHGFQAVVPRFNGMRQPLFAVYHQSMIEEIERFLKGNDFRVNNLWEKVKMLWLDEENLRFIPQIERAFYNMNKPEEYQQVQEWVTKK